MRILMADEVHEVFYRMLEPSGYECIKGETLDRSALVEALHSCHGLVVRSKLPIDAAFIREVKHLSFIARAGAGMDTIDREELNRFGIQLLGAPEGNRDAVAEHSIGMIFSLLNNLHSANQEVKKGIWEREKNRGRELNSLCVGIYGYGNMGKTLAKKLQSLVSEVIFYDRNEHVKEDSFAKRVDLKTFQEKIDVLSIHIPLDPDNHYRINDTFFDNIAKPIYFINTSRGEVLKTSALLNALKAGKILGAALDVLENEKLNTLSSEQKDLFNTLCAMPNVLLTPHVAGWTFESYKKISQVLAQKIIDQFPPKL